MTRPLDLAVITGSLLALAATTGTAVAVALTVFGVCAFAGGWIACELHRKAGA